MSNDIENGRLKSCSSSTTSDDRSSSPSSSLENRKVKFTKRKGFTKDACACVVVTVLVIVLGASAGIYYGLQYLESTKRSEVVFKGMFKVIEGDRYRSNYADSSSQEFQYRAKYYESKLDGLFNNSDVKDGFLKTEILALDKSEDGDELIVHFNLHTRIPNKGEVGAADIYMALANEVVKGSYSQHLTDLIVDEESIEVIERSPYAETVKDTWGPRQQIPGLLEGQIRTTTTERPTEPTHPPRKCTNQELRFCSGQLPFNVTSYPNVVGHLNIDEVIEDLVLYRQIADSECYAAAQNFVCHLLQPQCVDDKTMMPCRSYCQEFWNSCKRHIPNVVRGKIDCGQFPEYKGRRSCWTRPGCVNELKESKMEQRICDGIVDCPDKSDEYSCDGCKKGDFLCGDGSCIPMAKRCDDNLDCFNGADEAHCLSLAPKLSEASPERPLYHDDGYLIYNRAGFVGKICTDSLNNSLPRSRRDIVLHSLGTNTCELLGFRQFNEIEMVKDAEDGHESYFHLVDPLSSNINFLQSPCPSRHVLHLSCSHLECGRKPINNLLEDQSRDGQMSGHRKVKPTNWPWHASLFRDGEAKCDAAIVSDRWLITSSKCLKGSSASEWTARLGSVRHSSNGPYDVKNPVNGIIQSPYKGNDLVLVQLQHKIIFRDRILPVCLMPNLTQDVGPMPSSRTVFSQCLMFGWGDEGDSLNEIYAQVIQPMRCSNVSDDKNKICVDNLSRNGVNENKCDVKMMIGSTMTCYQDGRWTLIGINDEERCQRDGPLAFDKASVITQWIRETISRRRID